MRTTLTLDDDVAARLKSAVRKLRRPFRTKGFDLGPSLVGSLDNVEEILSRVEGEGHQ